MSPRSIHRILILPYFSTCYGFSSFQIYFDSKIKRGGKPLKKVSQTKYKCEQQRCSFTLFSSPRTFCFHSMSDFQFFTSFSACLYSLVHFPIGCCELCLRFGFLFLCSSSKRSLVLKSNIFQSRGIPRRRSASIGSISCARSRRPKTASVSRLGTTVQSSSDLWREQQ